MWSVIKSRLNEKRHTFAYPDGAAPPLPERFAGRPAFGAACSACSKRACADACPLAAIKPDGQLSLDLGLCTFCRACEAACQQRSLVFSREYRLAAPKRDDLLIRPGNETPPSLRRADLIRLFGRSLKLRQVSAGGCNACEADTNVLNTLAWDLGRFGIQFVASPRHADGLLITGPVSQNMRSALIKTYEATPAPKLVIVVGACACGGGLFADHTETHGGAAGLLPVDLFIPGCPPHPLTILDGLLRLLGKAAEVDAPVASP